MMKDSYKAILAEIIELVKRIVTLKTRTREVTTRAYRLTDEKKIDSVRKQIDTI